MRITPETYRENVEKNWDNPYSLSSPEFLTLLEDDGITISKESLVVYESIWIEERPEVLVLAKEPIHLRVLWGEEEISCS